MKTFFKFLSIAVLAFVFFILIKTFTFSTESLSVAPITPIEVPDEALARLQKAIQFKTISFSYTSEPDSIEFTGLHNHLASAFPLVDSLLEKKTIKYSLLYKWTGSDNSLKPIVLMSHMDVVPVDEGTLKDWEA